MVMERFIDLLNKHLKETREKNEDIGEYLNYTEDGIRTFLFEIDGAFYDINECVVLSKRYGFIKRLVENDKIDLQQLEDKLLKIGIYKNIGYYEGLLMLLSISDTPIDFLISILI